MKAVVLAAGRGLRLTPFSDWYAKPLMPVVNRPVMEHTLHCLRKIGIREVYSNLHYKADELQAYFGNGSRLGVSLTWRLEPTLTGPAGGAVLFSDCLGDDDSIVISGDALHDIDLLQLAEFHRHHGAILTVAMKRVPDPGRYGVGRLHEDGRVAAFAEKPDLPPGSTGLVSCGIYCVGPRALARIPRGVEYDFGRHLIPELAAEGAPVFGYETTAYWTDIGSPEALREANLDALRGLVNVEIPGVEREPGIFVQEDAVIDKGVTLRPPLLIGARSRIRHSARVIGPAVIGNDCEIGPKAYVSQSVLFPKSRLDPKMVLVGGLLGAPPEHKFISFT